MTTERLYHYNKELKNQQQLVAALAHLHPHLDSLDNALTDPHCKRTVEGALFLNADIHRMLDKNLSEFQQTLLNTLYPHYQPAMPAMGVVQLLPKTSHKTTLPSGTRIRTDPAHGEECIFTSRYSVNVQPIEVTETSFIGNILRLTLTCPESLTFSHLQPECLRFFINAPHEHACLMYEWLMNQTTQLRINNISLETQALQPVGFTVKEGMLPYTSRTFIGYRLLMEYFHFPEKFLFFELQGLEKIAWPKEHKVQLEFHFKTPQPFLTKQLNARWFLLGCTPIVNLFPHDLEPIKLTYDKTDYQLIPETQRIPQALEVHTIQRVLGIDAQQQGMEYLPLYGQQYNTDYPLAGYWYAHHRENMFLSILDASQHPNVTLCVKALCTNRHLPSELPTGGNEPRLLHEHAYVRSLMPLTPARRLYREQTNPTHWQLISHLATHYVSLSQEEDDTLQNLRNILELYDVNHNEQTSLLHLSTEPVTYRSPQSRGTAFRQGVHITLVVDESKFTGTNLYFFGCILERFLALYVTIEGFTQLTIITHDKKTEYRYPPRDVGELMDSLTATVP